MFLQPVLFFASALWLAAFFLAGIYSLFRRKSRSGEPISVHDRLIGSAAMLMIGALGAAVVVGGSILLGEIF